MIERESLIEIGKFLKTHALNGELNAVLDIDEAYIKDGNPIVVEKEGIFVPFYAASIRPKGASSFLIRLDGVDNIDQARDFVNLLIYAPADRCTGYIDEPEDNGRVYLSDLVGYNVIDTDGMKIVGEIVDIDETTENALFICQTPQGEIMIPAADDLVVDIDTEKKTIEMSLPQGLVEE